VKEILNIPDSFKTEVILQLGYPREGQPRPMKPREGADSIYVDRYGKSWDK
jgi:hypothetical protein